MLNKFTENYIELYWSNMNETDLRIRKQNNLYESNTYVKLSVTHNKIIENDIKYVNDKISMYKNLKSIKFKTVFYKDGLVENNLPHTHGNIIFLPYNRYFLLSTNSRYTLLFHELLHIFQRTYPIQTHKLLLHVWKLKVNCHKSSFMKTNPSRNNPDLNQLIYNSKFIYYEKYKEDANHLTNSHVHKIRLNESSDSNAYDDLISSFPIPIQYEHPFEVMACVISYYIMNNKLNENKSLHNWCINYL